MNKKVKYVVKVEVSYVRMNFEFDTSTLACNFMDMFLNHMTGGDSEKANVCMERIDVVDEAKGEE